jgi:hypothetical protein
MSAPTTTSRAGRTRKNTTTTTTSTTSTAATATPVVAPPAPPQLPADLESGLRRLKLARIRALAHCPCGAADRSWNHGPA